VSGGRGIDNSVTVRWGCHLVRERAGPEGGRRQRSTRKRRTTKTWISNQNWPVSHVAGDGRGHTFVERTTHRSIGRSLQDHREGEIEKGKGREHRIRHD
jgi:hypothetical protein